MPETPEEKLARETAEAKAKAVGAGAAPGDAIDIINGTPPPEDASDPKQVAQYLKDIRERLDVLIARTEPKATPAPAVSGNPTEGTPPPGQDPVNPPAPTSGTPVPATAEPKRKPLIYWE